MENLVIIGIIAGIITGITIMVIELIFFMFEDNLIYVIFKLSHYEQMKRENSRLKDKADELERVIEGMKKTKEVIKEELSQQYNSLYITKDRVIVILKELEELMFSTVVLTGEDLEKNKKEVNLLLKNIEVFYSNYVEMYHLSPQDYNSLYKTEDRVIVTLKELEEKLVFSPFLTGKDLEKTKKEVSLLLKDIEVFYSEYVEMYHLRIH